MEPATEVGASAGGGPSEAGKLFDSHVSDDGAAGFPTLGADSIEGRASVPRLLENKASPALKLAMHLVLVIVLHSTIYFSVPLWSCDASNGQCEDGSADCCQPSIGVSFFYLLCARYLFLSARQLRVGLPLVLRDRPMTDGGSGNSMTTWIRLLLVKYALNVPFLWEVQQVMDWTVEETSLDLVSYMLIEDIYIGTCLVRSNLFWRRYIKGKLHPWYNKLSQGFLFVLALLVVMVFPLYLFSSVNPIADANPIRRSHVSIRITAAPIAATSTSTAPLFPNVDSSGGLMASSGGTFDLAEFSRYAFAPLASQKLLDTEFKPFRCREAELNANAEQIKESCGYRYLLNAFTTYSADFQAVLFTRSSDSVWGVSSDARSRLRAALGNPTPLGNSTNVTASSDSTAFDAPESFAVDGPSPAAPPSMPPELVCATLPPMPAPDAPIQIEIEIAFRRALMLDGPGSDAISLTCARPLTVAERHALAAHMDGYGSPQVNFEGAFPKFVRLPSVRGSEAAELTGGSHFWHTLQNLSFSLQHAEAATAGVEAGGGGGGETWWEVRQSDDDASQFQASTGDGLKVIVVAERLAGGAAASSLAGGDVLVFYIVVVYAIGRAVRTACGGRRYKVMLDEMPDVKDIVEIIEAIHLARKSGQLRRETELHEMLLRLYRSPAVLLQITGERLKGVKEPHHHAHREEHSM